MLMLSLQIVITIVFQLSSVQFNLIQFNSKIISVLFEWAAHLKTLQHFMETLLILFLDIFCYEIDIQFSNI